MPFHGCEERAKPEAPQREVRNNPIEQRQEKNRQFIQNKMKYGKAPPLAQEKTLFDLGGSQAPYWLARTSVTGLESVADRLKTAAGTELNDKGESMEHYAKYVQD